jgi:tetratricopeptide (TPR) repeat protein
LHLQNEKGALLHYTKAIQLRPTEWSAWAALGDLYLRLGLLDHAEKTLREGLSFIEGSKRFGLASLYGAVLEERHDLRGAVASYEDAKKACGTCTEPGQQIAFFQLGMAYASLSPPRKSEAMAQLLSFQKMICKGAAASRYADQCTQVQIVAARIGGPLR